MKLSAILAPLIAAGVPGHVILETVKAFEEQQTDVLERRRANDRERQDRRRHVKSRDVAVTVPSHAGVTRGEDNLLSKKISGKKDLDAPQPKKGCRLPTDFQPDIEWAVSQGLSRQQAEMQASRFRDYWTAKPGKDGTKADWPATWRNWIRSHLERSGADAQPSQPVNWTTRLNHARRTNQWPAAQWGPPPGSPGCRAPPELLRDGDGVGWIEWKQVA